MALSFNSTGADSLTALVPVNGGFDDKLSDTGNVCNVQVDSIGTKSYLSTGPGTDYVVRQLTGTRPRRVTWLWRIKATSAANMNCVEALIEQYIAGGKAYALEDNVGRTTTRAVLLGPEEGTGRIGRRQTLAGGGAVLANWRLVFQVMQVAIGAEVL